MLYQSSKGPVEISTMPLSYAKNALNKLRRSEPERAAEIEALDTYVSELEATATAKSLAGPAPIGDNGGPPLVEPVTTTDPKGWDAIKTHLDDLLLEAGNWADGVEIVNQQQADTVARLKQDLQDGASLAETARVGEKKPLDEKIAEIQDRYNEYIAPLKNKKPGIVSKSTAALNNLLTAWLNKLDAEKRDRERVAAAAAQAAAAEAIAARTEAKETTDIQVMDRADDMLAQAEALLRQAKGVSNEKVQAQGSVRAIGLRSYWSAEITDTRAAMLHYIGTHRAEFDALVQRLADADARNEATRRTIPGVHFKEDRRAA
jgi:hypothetical protein